jgi:hypothetical protein
MTPLDAYDWPALEAELEEQGATVLPAVLSAPECRALADLAVLAPLRDALWIRLLPAAVRWDRALGESWHYGGGPGTLELQHLREGEGRPLHRDEADGAFPFRASLLLGAPGVDFDGGELALVERRPRMQSRPMVVPLGQGDVALFAANRRPCRGAKGPYRVSLQRGISRVRAGERACVEIGFAGGAAPPALFASTGPRRGSS